MVEYTLMRKVISIVGIVLLLLLGAGGQRMLARHRPGTAPTVNESLIATLGGFRSLAAEIIWWRADRLQREGRYGEQVQLATMLTNLQPHDPEVWNYVAWNLAYNVGARMPTLEDRWPWVYGSIRMLRDEGLKWNPGDPDLCYAIAEFFQLKIGAPDFDEAAPIYQREWIKLVRDARERNAWQESLAMDPAIMAEVERVYHVDDWEDPQTTAIYWAHVGLAKADERQQRMLKGRILTSKIVYERKRTPPVDAS